MCHALSFPLRIIRLLHGWWWFADSCFNFAQRKAIKTINILSLIITP